MVHLLPTLHHTVLEATIPTVLRVPTHQRAKALKSIGGHNNSQPNMRSASLREQYVAPFKWPHSRKSHCSTAVERDPPPHPYLHLRDTKCGPIDDRIDTPPLRTPPPNPLRLSSTKIVSSTSWSHARNVNNVTATRSDFPVDPRNKRQTPESPLTYGP